MSLTTGDTDIIGGGGYGVGFGGIAPVGLIGLNTLFNNGFGNGNGHGSIPGTTVLEQNVSDLRKDVADNGKELHILGNEIAGMFATQNLAFSGEFRNLDNKICDTEKLIANQGYSLSLQMNNFQHENDKQFCEVKQQINADGDATRALLTQNLIDDLRSQLAGEHRHRDNREIEISVNNSNTSIQQQVQAQAQQQNQFLASMFNALGDQVNRAANSVVNVGSGTVAGGQSNNQANTKVNS